MNIEDLLPEPPWEGPPVPRFVAKRTRNKLCQDMIELLRAQQAGEVIIEEFAHFDNSQLEDIVKYLRGEMEE